MAEVSAEGIQNQAHLALNVALHRRLFEDPLAVGHSSLKVMGVTGQPADSLHALVRA